MWSLRGENYAHWRILSCCCPQVVSQRWDLCTLKDIEMSLSSGGLSEMRNIHTEGYWDVIVLRWSLRGENCAHWRILSSCCPQVVSQRWELSTLKDIGMSLSLGSPSEVGSIHTEGYWDVIVLRWSLRGDNYAHWRILSCYCPQVVSQTDTDNEWQCYNASAGYSQD